MNVDVRRVANGVGKIKNFLDVDVDGTMFKGIKIVEKDGKELISWPAIKNGNKWFDVVKPSDELRTNVENAIRSKLMSINDTTASILSDEQYVEIHNMLFAGKPTIFGQDVINKVGFRMVKITGLLFATQNPNKTSKSAALAREGHKITWIIDNSTYIGRIIDGEYKKL